MSTAGILPWTADARPDWVSSRFSVYPRCGE